MEAGVATARQFDQYVSSTIVPRPLPNLDAVLPISPRLAAITEGHAHHATGALGLVETLGFAAMVGAADAMLKSANVRLVTYEKTGSGLCTAIIQGNVADVTVAVEAGMFEAERIGSLHAIMVIPRPLEDLMRSLPEPQQREATPQPLRLPLQVREKTPLVELPVLERVPEKLPVSVEAAVEELKQVSLQAEETDLL
jgi:carbon dioxide concentrating mechanism protein CcmO